jgi:hypothetical protein
MTTDRLTQQAIVPASPKFGNVEPHSVKVIDGVTIVHYSDDATTARRIRRAFAPSTAGERKNILYMMTWLHFLTLPGMTEALAVKLAQVMVMTPKRTWHG